MQTAQDITISNTNIVVAGTDIPLRRFLDNAYSLSIQTKAAGLSEVIRAVVRMVDTPTAIITDIQTYLASDEELSIVMAQADGKAYGLSQLYRYISRETTPIPQIYGRPTPLALTEARMASVRALRVAVEGSILVAAFQDAQQYLVGTPLHGYLLREQLSQIPQLTFIADREEAKAVCLLDDARIDDWLAIEQTAHESVFGVPLYVVRTRAQSRILFRSVLARISEEQIQEWNVWES